MAELEHEANIYNSTHSIHDALGVVVAAVVVLQLLLSYCYHGVVVVVVILLGFSLVSFVFFIRVFYLTVCCHIT